MPLKHLLLAKLRMIRTERHTLGTPGSTGVGENVFFVTIICLLYAATSYVFFPLPIWLKLVLIVAYQGVGIVIYLGILRLLSRGLYPSILLRKNFMGEGQPKLEIESIKQKMETNQEEIQRLKAQNEELTENDRLVIRTRQDEIGQMERTIEVLSYKQIHVSRGVYATVFFLPFIPIVVWEYFQYFG